MQMNPIPVSEKVTAFHQQTEKMLNSTLRNIDQFKEKLGLRGRKGRYDDAHYEFEGGAQDALRMKHYDKSLRLLWKAEEHAKWSSFRDCTKDELLIQQMAEKDLSPEEKRARKKFRTQEYRDFLKATYTLEQRQAIVNVLSVIGHGEAYAWLVSAELLNEVKSTGGRAALTMQVLEEAKHFVVLRELLEAFEVPIPRMNGWEYLWLEWIFKAKGTEKFFGMNVQVESVALTLFGMMGALPGLEILKLFHRDEARHTALPGNYLKEFPLTWWQKNNPANRLNRVKMLMPAVGLMFYIEKDLATLGVDVFDFGGTLTRKVNTLSDRVGFYGPVKGETLMPILNEIFNSYCKLTRPDFVEKDFMSSETTIGDEELALEKEIFGAAA